MNSIAQCVCVPGYSLDAGACAWTGVVLDPGFVNTPAGAWVFDGGAFIDPANTGAIDPGAAQFPTPSYCTGSGTMSQVAQVVTMPPFSAAEPMSLELSNEFICPSCSQPDLAVGFNHSFIDQMSPFGFTTSRICLGDSAFGGRVELLFQPWERILCVSGPTGYQIDHAEILPDSTCPVPGTVPDGDFETDGVWQFQSYGAGSDAGIVAGLGIGGSRAGYLQTGDNCGATLSNTLSLAGNARIPNQAIQFQANGSTSGSLLVNVGGRFNVGGFQAQVPGAGSLRSSSICVPEFAKGLVLPISFQLNSSDIRAACTQPNTAQFTVDNVTLASDSNCPAQAWLLDGDFEGSTPQNSWLYWFNCGGYAEVLANPSQAHSGTYSGHMFANLVSGGSTLSTTFSFPRASGTAGPALKLWYRVASLGAGDWATVGVNDAASTYVHLSASATTWTPLTMCLDPELWGRQQYLQMGVQTNQAGTSCATSVVADELFVDDIVVTTDPSCPTQ